MIRHSIADPTVTEYLDRRAISSLHGEGAAVGRSAYSDSAIQAIQTVESETTDARRNIAAAPGQSTRKADLGISARRPRNVAPRKEASCEKPLFLSDLLSAVKERLVDAASKVETIGGTDLTGSTAQSLVTTVLECAADLGSLPLTDPSELEHLEHLRMKLFDANTALAQARSELAGTRAGEMTALYQAMHDSLTELPNREFFAKRLKAALTRAASMHESLAVMYLDLDGFKQINDTHGHATGDEVLRIVGTRLSRLVRMEDMVGRLGGDEFGCLITDMTSHHQLEHLAAKMLDAVQAPCSMGAIALSIRASVGIAICPNDGLNALTLMHHADSAMYFAKRKRIGHAFFDQCGSL